MSVISVHFMGPINISTVEVFRNMLLNSLRNPNIDAIEILMSSEGGDINAGFTAYNYVRSLPVKTIAVNMGSIESIAVMPFLACDERRAVPTAKFILHNFHWGFGNSKIYMNQLQEHADCLHFDVERYVSVYNERTEGAIAPLDIRSHLTGTAAIIGADRAFRAGITTTDDTSFPTLTTTGGMWERIFNK